MWKTDIRRTPLALADTLLDRNHVGTDARGVDAIITSPLATGGAHVDAASSLVASYPNDYVVSESEPTTSLACLDATSIWIGCNDGPSGHRFWDVKRAVERLRQRQRGLDGRQIGIGVLA